MKNAIFDLDQTLVNSKILRQFRERREWQIVYSMIPRCSLYDGMAEVFHYILDHSIQICIVSSAPRPYIERMVRYFQIPCKIIVGYHDAIKTKPDPAPMIKAMELLNVSPSEVVSFGDSIIDIESSRGAGILSVACLWDSDDPICSNNADISITMPSQIPNYLY